MQFTPIKQLDRFRGVLAAQLLSSQTSGTFVINNASALGSQLVTMAAGYYARVTIEDEHILLSGFSVSGSTVTCTIASGGRGYNGTTAATHASDSVVENRFNKNDVDNLNNHLLRFDDGGMIVPLGTVVPTITDANTLSFAGVDYTAYLPVGMVILYKVVSTWYRATVTSSSFSTNTTVEITGDGLPASGTVLNFGMEMSRAVHANKIYDLLKTCVAAPAENAPSGYAWFYLDGGAYKMKDSAGTVSTFITDLMDLPVETISNLTTGEAIDGSTTPVAVAIKTSDGLLYKADANDNTLNKCIGFVTTNALITTEPTIQTRGVVTFPSGLVKNSLYYLQDTAGTIGVTPSATCSVPIGIATSTTKLLLTFGKRIAYGTISHTAAGAGTQDVTTTVGFRASVIVIGVTSLTESPSSRVASGVVTYYGTTRVGGCSVNPTGNSAVAVTNDNIQAYVGNADPVVQSSTAFATRVHGVLTMNAVGETSFTTRIVTTQTAGSGGTITGVLSYVAFE